MNFTISGEKAQLKSVETKIKKFEVQISKILSSGKAKCYKLNTTYVSNHYLADAVKFII